MTAATTGLARGQSSQTSPVVQTPLGALRGIATAGVNLFRGIPFAQPPMGPLRFRAPVAAAPWTGVRDATHFASAAMQPDEPAVPQSEDCLYLNVWAPSAPGTYPVFVWIHGGGFTGGRSFDALQDGSTFARTGVICVTIAYRLGVFGFLDVRQQLGPAYAGSANNALRDIIQALTWVQGNIAAFGGDPARVTVGGESAGAKLADMLMGVPSARPLFAQVISESGGAERVWPAARAQEVASGFSTQWTAIAGQSLATLKTAPARDLIAAQQRFTHDWPVHFPLRCEVDGTLLPQAPLEGIRGGAARGKRLLLGTNLDESALFIGPHPAADPAAKDLGNLTLAQFQPVEDKYKQLYPAMSEEQRRIRSLTAEEYWIPSLRVADAHVGAGGTAFVYRFDASPSSGRMAGLAFHSYELRFVWDRLPQNDLAPGDEQLAATIHAAWVAFIAGRAPDAAGLPTWRPYAVPGRPTMLLNTASHVENAPAEAEFQAWAGLLTH